MLVNLFLSCLLTFLRLYLFFDSVFAQKTPKIVTGFLHGCGNVWIWFCPLDYILKFPTKFLVKLCFGNFLIFLKFCLLFKISAPQKTTKKWSEVKKEIRHKPNVFFLFIINVKVFNKFVFFSFTYCKLRGMFCLLKIAISGISWFEYWTEQMCQCFS